MHRPLIAAPIVLALGASVSSPATASAAQAVRQLVPDTSMRESLETVVSDELKTRAERTDYQETTSYQEVMRLVAELQKHTSRLRVETFGRSEEGRALPLLVFSDPPITDPRDTRASAKPIVFVMANIHAGEVEGKEALLALARRIAAGDLSSLLDKLTILLAPIYNADGNERVGPDNRVEQNGPIGGVGIRENAKGLDLNRDFIKLESSEARALVGLMNRWDPHVVVDLHTTNGSYHGYHLTYAPTLNPNADARLIAYERNDMLPSITRAMQLRHRFRTYYYGNFAPRAALDRELTAYVQPGRQRSGAPAASTEPRVWRTFDHRPRFGNNYVGLRNRIAILSEAYSYLDFKRRVTVTAAFVEEVFRYCGDNGAEIRQLTRRIDLDTMQQTPATALPDQGVDFELSPLPRQMPILVGAVEKKKNPRSGREMTAMQETYIPVRMPDFGMFSATRSVPMPPAYLVPPGRAAVALTGRLLAQGVAVEQLIDPVSIDVESFVVDRVVRAESTFQGHTEVAVQGRLNQEHLTFPAGTLLVRTTQPLARLVFYLLDPQSDDGLTTWNVLDEEIASGKPHPVFRAMTDVRAAARLIGLEPEN